MHLRFSAQPGRWERQLQRRHDNPLFGEPPPRVSRGELDRARSRDRQESGRFRNEVETLFGEAAQLQPNTDSGLILRLKERLDQAWERAAGLAGGEPQVRAGLARLTGVIMQAVRRGAGTDPRARAELDAEDQARALHYRLLEQPLVADLLAPEEPIPPAELAATLLSAAPAELAAALELFDPEQRAELAVAAAALLEHRRPEEPLLTRARTNLTRLRQYVTAPED
jgi:hypothetical protein